MRMTALLSAALICSCNQTTKVDKPKNEDARELSIKTTFAGHSPVEGELGVFEIRIHNPMPHFAVLQEIVSPEGGPVIRWQVSRPGNLEFSPGADTWTYDRKAEGQERPVFNRGMLYPGEDIVIRPRFRLLKLPRKFSLRYFAFRREDIGTFVYFEKKSQKAVHFVRLLGRDLEIALSPDPAPDVSSHRMVIFPHAEQVDARPLSQPFELALELVPRTFSASQAAAKAGMTGVDETTYCSALNGWVLRSGKNSFLVTSTSSVPLPPIASLERFFHLVDALPGAAVQIEFQSEISPFLPKDYKLAVDRQRNKMYLILPKSELPDLFGKIREVPGATLDAALDSDGTGRILVSKEK